MALLSEKGLLIKAVYPDRKTGAWMRQLLFLIWVVMAGQAFGAATMGAEATADFYVSTIGSEHWSGTLAEQQIASIKNEVEPNEN